MVARTKLEIAAPIEMVYEHLVLPDLFKNWSPTAYPEYEKKVECASDVEEGMRFRYAGKKHQFEAVLTDVEMPTRYAAEFTSKHFDYEEIFRLKRISECATQVEAVATITMKSFWYRLVFFGSLNGCAPEQKKSIKRLKKAVEKEWAGK